MTNPVDDELDRILWNAISQAATAAINLETPAYEESLEWTFDEAKRDMFSHLAKRAEYPLITVEATPTPQLAWTIRHKKLDQHHIRHVSIMVLNLNN